MIRYKHDKTDDRQLPGLAENKRLQEALKKIYSEAMMANEPPESTWYRIAEIADLALAREEVK